MGKAIREHLNPASRQKVYLTLVFISLTLLFYSIWQIKPVIVEVDAPLGLASYFTPCYWIGLALLVLGSIFAFLDRELKRDAIFMLILLALGMFLLGTIVFAYQNPYSPNTYYPYSEVRSLLATHHLDISHPPTSTSYYMWPAIHFTSASILEISGVGFGFIKYMPLFWIVSVVFITYSIGKRLELAPNYCFLISFLALSTELFSFCAYYYGRFLGIILVLLLFMLLFTPRRTVAETVAAVLMFSALVLCHGLTALSVIPGVILLSIYRKDAGFVALFLVIFLSWYMYQASLAFEMGIDALLDAFIHPLGEIRHLTQVERYQTAASTAVLAMRYSQLAYLALYFVLVSGSAILLLGRRITGERRKQVIALFCWTIGVGLLVFYGHGEVTYRVYGFCLVPAACIIVVSFSGRKLTSALAIALMCLLPVLSPLANYSADTLWGQVLTTELKGAQFFALEVEKAMPTHQRVYYGFGGQLLLYYDPTLRHFGRYDPQWITPGVLGDPRRQPEYVIISRQGTQRGAFAGGEDPYSAWPQTEVGRIADLIYNNGYFQIYVNHSALYI